MADENNEKGNTSSEERDEELDVAKATEKARDFMKKIVPNLISSQFRLEMIKQNGKKTIYNIICSVVPDLGAERDYYLIKVDVATGKIVQPVGRGKLKNDTIEFQKVEAPNEWLE